VVGMSHDGMAHYCCIEEYVLLVWLRLVAWQEIYTTIGLC